MLKLLEGFRIRPKLSYNLWLCSYADYETSSYLSGYVLLIESAECFYCVVHLQIKCSNNVIDVQV